MAITYEYKIEQLEITNSTDQGVVQVHYRIYAEDAGEHAQNYGVVSLTPDPTSPNYTPFDQLTEAEVVGWVKNELDTSTIEQSLAERLKEKLNPPVVQADLPWME